MRGFCTKFPGRGVREGNPEAGRGRIRGWVMRYPGVAGLEDSTA